jgi:hypothetical protein
VSRSFLWSTSSLVQRGGNVTPRHKSWHFQRNFWNYAEMLAAWWHTLSLRRISFCLRKAGYFTWIAPFKCNRLCSSSLYSLLTHGPETEKENCFVHPNTIPADCNVLNIHLWGCSVLLLHRCSLQKRDEVINPLLITSEVAIIGGTMRCAKCTLAHPNVSHTRNIFQ